MVEDGVPPGWYDDPSGRGGQRWWDGTSWTNSFLPAEPEPVASEPGPDRPRPDRVENLGRNGRGRLIALLSVAAVGLVAAGIVGVQVVSGRSDDPPELRVGDGDAGGDVAGVGSDDPVRGGDPDEQSVDAIAEVRSVESFDVTMHHPGLASVSPTGDAVLVRSLEGEAQTCLHRIGSREPELCHTGFHLDTEYTSWSDDGRRAVVGDALFRNVAGGRVVLFDRDSGVSEIFDTTPLTRENAGGAVRAVTRPAISPDGRRVAGLLYSDGPGPLELVVLDLATGTEDVVADGLYYASRLLWEPGGDAVWVSRDGPEDEARGFERIDLLTGERRSLPNDVPLEAQAPEGDRSRAGQLVQISDDGRRGLVFLSDVAFVEDRGIPAAAVIDLETGVSGPVLPVANTDDEAAFFRFHAARLRSDGGSVLVTYLAERPTGGETAVENPLRLVSVSSQTILDGRPEPVTLLEDLSERTDLPNPWVAWAGPSGHRWLVTLPGSDTSVLLPLGRLGPGGPVGDDIEQVLEVTFDRPF